MPHVVDADAEGVDLEVVAVEPHTFVVEGGLHGDVDVVVKHHAYEEDHELHGDDDDLDDMVHCRRVHYGGWVRMVEEPNETITPK